MAANAPQIACGIAIQTIENTPIQTIENTPIQTIENTPIQFTLNENTTTDTAFRALVHRYVTGQGGEDVRNIAESQLDIMLVLSEEGLDDEGHVCSVKV